MSAQKPTQRELVYEFITDKGRVFTHELNEWACQAHITNPGGRARELKGEGKIWRMDEHLKKTLFPNAKDDIWSVFPEDRDAPTELESMTAEHNYHAEMIKNNQAEFAGMGRVNYGV